MANRSNSNRSAHSNRTRDSGTSFSKSFFSDTGMPPLEEEWTFGIPPCEVPLGQAFSDQNLYLYNRFTEHPDALTGNRIALRMEMKIMVMVLLWTDPNKLKSVIEFAKYRYTDEQLKRFHPALRPGMRHEEVCDMLLSHIGKHHYIVGMCEELEEKEIWLILVSILRAATWRREGLGNEVKQGSLPALPEEVESRWPWGEEAAQPSSVPLPMKIEIERMEFEEGFGNKTPKYLVELETKWPGGIATSLDYGQRAPALEQVRKEYAVNGYGRPPVARHQKMEPGDVNRSKKASVYLPGWSELKPKLRKSKTTW